MIEKLINQQQITEIENGKVVVLINKINEEIKIEKTEYYIKCKYTKP